MYLRNKHTYIISSASYEENCVAFEVKQHNIGFSHFQVARKY